jgi:hypothetical protein
MADRTESRSVIFSFKGRSFLRAAAIGVLVLSFLFAPVLVGCGGSGGGSSNYSKAPEADPMKGRQITPPPGVPLKGLKK